MRAFLHLTLLSTVAGCVAGDEYATTSSEKPVYQALREGDDATACRGRYYPVWKDNRTPQMPKSDVELIDTLIPHHQGAVMMAEIEIERGTNADVICMAENMKSDQSAEIETLLRIREELTGCTTVTRYADPAMDRDMQALQSASDAELDRLFVDHMIPHHASAIAFTHAAMANLAHAELKTLAHEIVHAQTMEIHHLHMMQMMLEGHHMDGMGCAEHMAHACEAPQM